MGPTGNCREFKFEILLDDYPGDISWELKNTKTNKVILSRDSAYYGGKSKGETDVVTECIVPQCMNFTIDDSWGDGLITPGSYYKTSWNKEIVLENSCCDKWESENVEFGCDDDTAPPNSAPSPTASPTDAPTTSPTKAPTASPTASPTA